MQTSHHPKYNSTATVTCSCGNTFTTGSTLTDIKVDICSNCHPFYTGETRFVDTQGRVEKFQLKMQNLQAPKKKKNHGQVEAYTAPKSLKEMLSSGKR